MTRGWSARSRIWAVPAGIIGGRIYFDLTTPKYIPHHWYGVFAVWDGGLGIWGGIALAAVVGMWRVHRSGASAYLFMDAVAPALLVAQAIGRVGNYFNQELFGGPTTLPWALQISPQFRPAGYAQYTTFHPTFLYELIFDLAWRGGAGLARPPPRGQAARAVRAVRQRATRRSASSRSRCGSDPSEHFLGLRLNMYVASVLTVVGIAWFIRSQRRGRPAGELLARRPASADGETTAAPSGDEAGATSGGAAGASDAAPSPAEPGDAAPSPAESSDSASSPAESSESAR